MRFFAYKTKRAAHPNRIAMRRIFSTSPASTHASIVARYVSVDSAARAAAFFIERN